MCPGISCPIGQVLFSQNPEVQTAVATWAVVIATLLAFGATIYAVRATFRHERQSKQDECLKRDRAALRAVTRGTATITDAVAFEFKKDPSMIWQWVGRVDADRRVAEHYLKSDLGDDELPFLLADTIQRGYDIRSGLIDVLPKPVGKNGDINKLANIVKDAERKMTDMPARILMVGRRIS